MNNTTKATAAADKIKLTESQDRILKQMLAFIDDEDHRVFILKGYAGTGKTTLMRFFIKELAKRERQFQLLASTGRAAKVLSDIAVKNRFDENQMGNARTIHSLIYNYSGFNREISEEEMSSGNAKGQLLIDFIPTSVPQNDEDTVYIIDEASMIGDKEANEYNIIQAKFGTGRLLTELMEYDKRDGSKYVFVGDPCQLPPVGDIVSPALDENHFEPPALTGTLTEIMRQDNTNSIVAISKRVRDMADTAPENESFYPKGAKAVFRKLPFGTSKNVVMYPTIEKMVEGYVANIKSSGYTSCTLICRYNKANSDMARKVRSLLGHFSAMPEAGDLLLVTQNNSISSLVNGDLVEVTYANPNIQRMAGLNFMDVQVREIASGREFRQLMILEPLVSDMTNLSPTQQTNLFLDFFIRMSKHGIRQKSDAFVMALEKDPYLNALRCNYGYSLTCHKAQGGEWKDVYLNFPRNIGCNPTKQNYRWVYTAITRASEYLHIVYDWVYIDRG